MESIGHLPPVEKIYIMDSIFEQQKSYTCMKAEKQKFFYVVKNKEIRNGRRCAKSTSSKNIITYACFKLLDCIETIMLFRVGVNVPYNIREFINQLITGIIDGLFSLWKVLTSKEAKKIYILIGKGIFFFLVIAVTILGAIAEAQNKRKRRRY